MAVEDRKNIAIIVSLAVVIFPISTEAVDSNQNYTRGSFSMHKLMQISMIQKTDTDKCTLESPKPNGIVIIKKVIKMSFIIHRIK